MRGQSIGGIPTFQINIPGAFVDPVFKGVVPIELADRKYQLTLAVTFKSSILRDW